MNRHRGAVDSADHIFQKYEKNEKENPEIFVNDDSSVMKITSKKTSADRGCHQRLFCKLLKEESCVGYPRNLICRSSVEDSMRRRVQP